MGTTTKASARRTVKDPTERRDEIVAAARTLFRERGISATSFTDVARHVGVARGLIYHYFPDKDALVDVVLEQYVAEFVASVAAWDAAREPGNIDRALIDCIAVFRHHLRTTSDPLREDLQRIEHAGIYNRFLDRAVRAVVDCFQATTVQAYARQHKIELEHVYETFYVLVYGLVGFVRNNPQASDDVLVTIVRQALYLPPRSTPPGA